MFKRLQRIVPALILASTVLSGCFAWNYVKDGYRDFSAYFNTFYNAQDAFDNGMKDVLNSLKERNISIIGGAQPTPFVISGTARQNFDLAIEKASKVLQYYPTSAFTQDCLFMIGISYYYEGDNLKGGRKFVEVEAAFPNSDRYSEALMYQGGMLLRQEAFSAGYDSLKRGLSLARAAKNWEIAAGCCARLSDYYLATADTVTAAAYLDTASAYSSGDDAAIYACLSGALYDGQGHERMALRTYQRGWATARDIRLKFYSKYYYACAQADLHLFSPALLSLGEVRNDDKYFQFFPLIEYRQAQVLYDSGAVSTAVTEFQRIDTTFTQDQAATRSAYALANVYLYKVGDYPTALKYFQRCTSHPAVYGLTTNALNLSKLLQEYFIDKYRVTLADSNETRVREAAARGDTTIPHGQALIDTLYEHTAAAENVLAGFFMYKLEIPDSAVNHYRSIIDHYQRSKVYPSALYTLGEYYFSESDSAAGRTYLDLLLTTHPESEYAGAASSLLGRRGVPVADSAEMKYQEAIQLVDSGRYVPAIQILNGLSRNLKSTLAPQALYTIGWIYENNLGLSDSAAKYYRLVSTGFPSSQFSSDVKLALSGYDQAQADSAKARQRRQDSTAASGTASPAKPGAEGALQILQRNERMSDSLATKEGLRPVTNPDSTATRRQLIR